MIFKKRSATQQDNDPAVNLNRTADLFASTVDGYIIAQDSACQHEFIEEQRCPNCGGVLMPIAQINRAFQGLNEVVTLCTECGERSSFIFDISNDVYQLWWAERMGEMYVRTFDGQPRVPAQAEAVKKPRRRKR
jgi:hypothetical protein